MKTRMQFKNLNFIWLMFVAVACTPTQGEVAPGAAGQAKEYQVISIKEQKTTLDKSYPAVLEGQQTVEIRPRVAGYIEEILVDEGAFVKKGQILFRLNANDIEANVRSAEAQVKVAEAQVATAKINVGKTKPLVDKNIISKFELESVESTLKAAEAQLAQAQANMENAKANLQYTKISSPTDGIIGNFPYRVGSLVSSAIAEPLTTVSNTTSMYAYFSMNEKDFLKMTRGLEGANMQEKLKSIPDVSLLLADNTAFEFAGKVETASGLVDQQTGSINIRASFPNPEHMLRSGSSGVVRISEHMNSVILIPQKASYELQGKHFVYLVGEDNKVQNTSIEVIAGNLKDTYVVTSGLSVGDQLVIEGINSLRNQTRIKPKLTELSTLNESELSANSSRN
ncbi:efflux RND transporter periplasmic adaptor subunit [Sunxiuqinia sp. sy24]|uniref:efflux RND transporter periplasmic adaptor subunit n=1 Tax=Sunxiuqinia sp. sy24 TaxID=3461495 RepID=UPI0040459549